MADFPSSTRSARAQQSAMHALETDWPVEAGGFEPLHFGIRSAAVDHGLRLSSGMRSGTTNFSKFESCPPGLRVFANSDSEIQRFESSRLTGQSVSNAYGIGSCSKCRDIAAFPSSSLVSVSENSPTEVGFWCPVSEGHILVSRFMQPQQRL
jgi:hypothetical protein